MVRRIYVEKKPALRQEAAGLLNELRSLLGISALTGLLRVTEESSGMDFGGNNQEEDGKRKGWVSP